MRRAEWLILQVRRQTENDDIVSNTAGIIDDEFVEYLNRAQDHLFSEIFKVNANVFATQFLINSVAMQEAYPLDERVFFSNGILMVEFTLTGSVQDYIKLRSASLVERNTSFTALVPYEYMARQGQLLLNPIPTRSQINAIRLNAVLRPDKIDVRRAVVLAVTLDTTNNLITSLTFDKNSTTPVFSTSNILVDDYFCIVDQNGTVQMRKIPITSVNPSNGVATIAPGFVFQAGETIAIGNYLVAGRNATTHSQLPDVCERYLIEFCSKRIMLRDSSEDTVYQDQELKSIEEDIITACSVLLSNPSYITVLNNDMVSF